MEQKLYQDHMIGRSEFGTYRRGSVRCHLGFSSLLIVVLIYNILRRNFDVNYLIVETVIFSSTEKCGWWLRQKIKKRKKN